MARLGNNEFLKQTADLLAKQGHNYYTITQKRLSYDIENEITAPEFNEINDLGKDVTPAVHTKTSGSETRQYPILLRITDGSRDKSKKIKLSTVVEPKDFDLFWSKYITILKSSFNDLKKTKKNKKAKAKKNSKKVNA